MNRHEGSCTKRKGASSSVDEEEPAFGLGTHVGLSEDDCDLELVEILTRGLRPKRILISSEIKRGLAA